MKTKHFPFLAGLLIGALGLYLIQYLSAKTKASSEMLPVPFYTTLFENDEIRILNHVINPGEGEPKHSHPPMYAYFIGDTEATVTNELDGSVLVRHLKDGEHFLVPATTHSIVNTGTGTLHSILVELK